MKKKLEETTITINGKKVIYREDGRFTLPKGWTDEDHEAFMKFIVESQRKGG